MHQSNPKYADDTVDGRQSKETSRTPWQASKEEQEEGTNYLL